MRFARRIDQNHVAIVNELAKRGVHAVNLTTAGDGICDIITYFRGKTVFIEIKFGRDARLKKTQLKFIGNWPGFIGIARNAEEAYSLATEPERYALTAKDKDRFLAVYARTEGPHVYLQTLLESLNR